MEASLVQLIHPDLARLTEAEFVMHLPTAIDDGGARRRTREAEATLRTTLEQAARDGLLPGAPAWRQRATAATQAAMRVAEALEQEAPVHERAALEARAATLRAAAPPAVDPVVEARRQVTREKLARQHPEPSDRHRVLLAAARDGTPEAREVIEATLTEPAPRGLLSDTQRAELEAHIVAARAPDAIRDAHRAKKKREAAMALRNAAGEPAFIRVGP